MTFRRLLESITRIFEETFSEIGVFNSNGKKYLVSKSYHCSVGRGKCEVPRDGNMDKKKYQRLIMAAGQMGMRFDAKLNYIIWKHKENYYGGMVLENTGVEGLDGIEVVVKTVIVQKDKTSADKLFKKVNKKYVYNVEDNF